MAKFVNPLIQSREQAHVFHLTTKNFSTHSALRDYYTKIVDLIDRFTETYSATHKSLGSFRGSGRLLKDASTTRIIAYFKTLAVKVRRTRFSKKEPWLDNIRIEVLELIMNTIYKLRLDGTRRRTTSKNSKGGLEGVYSGNSAKLNTNNNATRQTNRRSVV